MTYDVFLGNLTIYGVTDLREDSGRGITVHNGLGQGNFTQADDKDLRSWEVDCEFTEMSRGLPGWVAAKDLFRQLESLLEDKNPQRLVIASDYTKISAPVFLEKYTKAEKYAGVYDIRLKFMEHKEAGVKTTGVPYVSRPGKVPVQPEAKVFTKGAQVGADAIARSLPGGSLAEVNRLRYEWEQGGERKQTKNPNMVPTNTTVLITTETPGPAYTQYSGTGGIGADYDFMADVRGSKGDTSLSQLQRKKTGDAFVAINEGLKKFFDALAK